MLLKQLLNNKKKIVLQRGWLTRKLSVVGDGGYSRRVCSKYIFKEGGLLKRGGEIFRVALGTFKKNYE